MSESVGEFIGAMAHIAAAVSVITVREDRDDVGTTVNTFTSVSLDPPLVMVSVANKGYINEMLLRQDRWAASVLSEEQSVIASRFATPGRPSARLIVEGIPHHRGPASGAIIIEGGVAAIEAETTQVVPTGDHTLYVARVLAVDYADPETWPLVRLRGRYRAFER